MSPLVTNPATHVRYIGGARVTVRWRKTGGRDVFDGSVETSDGVVWNFTDLGVPAYLRRGADFDPDDPETGDRLAEIAVEWSIDADGNQRGSHAEILRAVKPAMLEDGWATERSSENWRARLNPARPSKCKYCGSVVDDRPYCGNCGRPRAPLKSRSADAITLDVARSRLKNPPGDGRRRASRSEVMPFGDLVDALELYNDNTDGDMGGETVSVFLWDDDWQLMGMMTPNKALKHQKEYGGKFVSVRLPGHNKPFNATKVAHDIFTKLGLRHLNPPAGKEWVVYLIDRKDPLRWDSKGVMSLSKTQMLVVLPVAEEVPEDENRQLVWRGRASNSIDAIHIAAKVYHERGSR